MAGDKIGRILVVGGGIGGLAAATALAHRDFEVELVEKRSRFAEEGVGLGQPANALRALRALGVLDECLGVGFAFDRIRFCDFNRKLIVEHRLLLGGDVPPAIALPRVEVHRILLQAVERAGVKVRMGTTPAELKRQGREVLLTYADGSIGTFDLVVGFDGINAWTRRTLFGTAHDPTYTGFAAWRLIVERPSDVTCMEFYQGFGSKTGVMPLNEKAMYLFYVGPEPGNPRQDPSKFKDLLRERLQGYGGVAADIRDSLSGSDEIVYSPIELVWVPSPWYRDRVIIGGDAAHASPPHLTQGAGMALEDGVVLAEELAKDKPLARKLIDFMDRRLERCRFVQDFSYEMLIGEQSITTQRDLDAAKSEMKANHSSWLASADRVMNQRVLETN